MQTGQIFAFLQKNKLALGVCQFDNPKHIRVLTESNKELNLRENKVLYICQASVPTSSSRLERVDFLKSWQDKLAASHTQIDLAMLWEVMEGETEAIDLQTLADMYFSTPSDEDALVLLQALLADRIYFGRKGDEGFLRRGAEHVQQTQILIQKEQEKEAEELAFQTWFSTALSPPVQPLEAHLHKFLEPVKDVAIQGKRSAKYAQVGQLFNALGKGGNLEEKTFQVMVNAGIWDEDENLHLIEQNVPRHFTDELLQETQKMTLDIASYQASRHDLSALYTISIDDAATTDIDDALSWAPADDGYRLWIHIADPSELIVPETLLDKEAARRFTSIYLCEGKIEMLPAHLAQNLSSLVAGQLRLALSVEVHFDKQFEMQDYQIMESVIQVDRRMTYDDVEQELPGNDMLKTMLQLSEYLQQKRVERGALVFNRPELSIKVTPEKEILIKKVARDSPSQNLVSEMMILANRLVAKALSENQVPMIYKAQAPPLETSISGKPILKRSELTTTPSEHYGLGLDVYTQFTSPIRRYNDLLLHRQIKAWLRQHDLPYDLDALRHMIALSDQALFSANFIQRDNHRYWLLKYIERLETPRIFEAEVNFKTDDRMSVHLFAFCFDTPFPVADAQGLQEGDKFWLEITRVHPRRGQLNFRRCAAPGEQASEIVVTETQEAAQTDDGA